MALQDHTKLLAKNCHSAESSTILPISWNKSVRNACFSENYEAKARGVKINLSLAIIVT